MGDDYGNLMHRLHIPSSAPQAYPQPEALDSRYNAWSSPSSVPSVYNPTPTLLPHLDPLLQPSTGHTRPAFPSRHCPPNPPLPPHDIPIYPRHSNFMSSPHETPQDLPQLNANTVDGPSSALEAHLPMTPSGLGCHDKHALFLKAHALSIAQQIGKAHHALHGSRDYVADEEVKQATISYLLAAGTKLQAHLPFLWVPVQSSSPDVDVAVYGKSAEAALMAASNGPPHPLPVAGLAALQSLPPDTVCHLAMERLIDPKEVADILGQLHSNPGAEMPYNYPGSQQPYDAPTRRRPAYTRPHESRVPPQGTSRTPVTNSRPLADPVPQWPSYEAARQTAAPPDSVMDSFLGRYVSYRPDGQAYFDENLMRALHVMHPTNLAGRNYQSHTHIVRTSSANAAGISSLTRGSASGTVHTTQGQSPGTSMSVSDAFHGLHIPDSSHMRHQLASEGELPGRCWHGSVVSEGAAGQQFGPRRLNMYGPDGRQDGSSSLDTTAVYRDGTPFRSGRGLSVGGIAGASGGTAFVQQGPGAGLSPGVRRGHGSLEVGLRNEGSTRSEAFDSMSVRLNTQEAWGGRESAPGALGRDANWLAHEGGPEGGERADRYASIVTRPSNSQVCNSGIGRGVDASNEEW